MIRSIHVIWSIFDFINLDTRLLKMQKLKKLVIEHRVDILSLLELNKDWRKVPYSETIWSSMSGWSESQRIQTSNNTFVSQVMDASLQ